MTAHLRLSKNEIRRHRSAVFAASRLAFLLLAIVTAIVASAPSMAFAAAITPQASDERTISRYLTLLEKRPAAGAAFDRVFNHYDQSGRIDELVAKLRQPAVSDQAESARHLLLGMVYVRTKNAELAIEQLKLAAKARPSDLTIDDQIAQAWIMESEFENAASAWQAAFSKSTTPAASLRFAKQLVSVYGKLRQNDDALAILLEFDNQFPGDPEIQELLTTALIDSGRTDEAVAKLKAQLAKASKTEDKIKIETQLADLMLKAGRISEAVTAYESILSRLNPESWQADELDAKLKKVLAREPDQVALENYLKQRLSTDPSSLAKRTDFMAFLGRNDRHEESLLVATKAPDTQQSSPLLIRSRIADYLALKKFQQLEAEYLRLESSNALSVDDVVRWGQITLGRSDLSIAERKEKAVDRWNRLLTIADSETPEWQRRATLAAQFASNGLTQDAEAQYLLAIELGNCGPGVFLSYSELLLRQNQVEKAMPVLQRLVAGSPKTSSAFMRVISTLKSFKQPKAAAEFSAQLVAVDASSDNRMLHAELLFMNGDFTSADQQLNQVFNSSTPSQQKGIRQQAVDIMLRTDFVSKKIQQLRSQSVLGDSELLLLAELAEVQGSLALALQSVQKVKQTSAQWAFALEIQAGLQQKAGQLKEAETTLRTLAAMNPKRSLEYQETIQNLQLQMGRDEDAFKSASLLFQSTPRSASSVSRYVAFLKNSNRQQEAIVVLSSFLNQQASSAEMMVELGDLLSEQFRSADAMDWFWKAMDQSTSESLQRDIATRLVVLALRTNQTESVLQRLKSTVRQDSSASAAHQTLLMVDALRQARQLTDAVEELEQFLAVESGNIAAMTELVDLLSKLDRSDEAVGYQFRLARLDPSKEAFNRLADLLENEGQLQRYEADFRQLALISGWPEVAIKLVDRLLKSKRAEDASVMVDTLKVSTLAEWKIQSRQIAATIEKEETEVAQALAIQLYQQQVTSADLLEISTTEVVEHFYQVESLAQAHVAAGQLAIGNASDEKTPLRQMLEKWNVQKQLPQIPDEKLMTFAADTICLHRQRALTAADVSDTASRLSMLKSKTAPVAALSLLLAIDSDHAELNGKSTVARWNVDVGKLALRLLPQLQKQTPELLTQSVFQLVHQRMISADLFDQAIDLRQRIIPKSFTGDPSQLADFWDLAKSNQDLGFANLLLNQWIKGNDSDVDSAVKISLPEDFGRSVAMFSSLADLAQRKLLLQKFMILKSASARTSGRSTSSGSGRSFEVVWTEKTSHRIFEGGRHVGSRNVVTLPAHSLIEMTDVTFFVNLLHGLSQDEQKTLSTFLSQAADQQKQGTTKVFYRLACAHLLCLQSRFDDAILEVIDAAKTDPDLGSLRVLIAAYHAENGHALSALNLLESISTSDVRAYQQALWLKLRIGSSSGQLAVASQAAESLLGTRLTQDERRHLALVTKTFQLDAAPRPSESPASKNVRPMENLVQQMQRMQQDGQVDKAIEIANSILLTSDATQHTTRMSTSARKSAVNVLAKYQQLDTALRDVDRRLSQNQKSSDLLRLKLQILNGMKLTAEATIVQEQLAALVPNSPEDWIQMARDFEDGRRFSAAADTYMKAFQAKPSLLLADYYRYFKVFRRIDRLPDLADLLLKSDLKQLRDNYFVVSELIDVLLSQTDSTELGRRSIQSGFKLLNAAWRAFPSDQDYLLNNIQARRLWESKLVVDYICDSLIPDTAQRAFARPWLGLDSKPVDVEGEGRLCALQRVLLYLQDGEARRSFLQRVVAGQEAFPEWQAGPYVEAALRFRNQDDESAQRDLLQRLRKLCASDENLHPPQIAAVNIARILRRVDPEIDGQLAELLSVVKSKSEGQAVSRGSIRTPFQNSSEHLQAELLFSAGKMAAGRRTVHRALMQSESQVAQVADAESAWNRIQSVLSAVELLRSAGLPLDAVAIAKTVSPRLLMQSRGFQSNDSLDRACQRMWIQSKRTVQSANLQDVLAYLNLQADSIKNGHASTLDLLLNTPSWNDRVSWRNSDLMTMLKRISQTGPDAKKRLKQAFEQLKEDQLSSSLCMLAMRSADANTTDYFASVSQFATEWSERANSQNKLPQNGVLLWCLVSESQQQSSDARGSISPNEELIRNVMQLSLNAESADGDLAVWKHCILNEAATLFLNAGNTDAAAAAWSKSLGTLAPPLVKQPTTDRSPLKETRRLLLGP